MTEQDAPPETEVCPPPALGRPRSAAVRRAILEAAYVILVEDGIGGFSIDAVATRAHVARTTIYRWWPNKRLLACACFLEAFRPQLSFNQSGSSADDFRELLISLARALSGPDGRIAASIVAQAQSDAETQRLFLEAFSEPLRQHSSALLNAGIAQGRFRADLDIGRVLDAAIGAVYLRLLFGQSMDKTWAIRLADTLLLGCLTPQTETVRPIT